MIKAAFTKDQCSSGSISIGSGTGSPELCWIHMGTVPPWKGTVPNWITFESEPIWYGIKEPTYSGSARSCIKARLICTKFVLVPNGSGLVQT